MENFINNLFQSKIVNSIIIIVVSFTIYRIVKSISAKTATALL